MARTRCWTCKTFYDPDGDCPQCHEIQERRRIQEESDERHANVARDQSDLSREHEEAEQQRHEELLEAEQRRHEELLEHQAELEEQRREQRELELEAQREAWQEETVRRRELSEAEMAHRRDITANAWQLQAESKRLRGCELFSAGLHEEGLAKLNESVKEDPGNLDGWASLANVYRALEDLANRDRAIRKQLSLLRLPKYGRYVGNFDRTLEQISGLAPEFLSEFTTVVNERCSQVETGDSNTLETWQGLARVFKNIRNSAGWRRSILNQIGLLNSSELLRDFVFVLDQIPNNETDLLAHVHNTLTSRSNSLRISKGNTSEISRLLERGFADQVCSLIRSMPQDLTVQGLLVWTLLRMLIINAPTPTRELDAYLRAIPCEKRMEIRKQYSDSDGFFSNAGLNLDTDRRIRNALFVSLRDQYIRWTPQICDQFKQLALQQVDLRAIREGAENWAKGAAVAAFLIAMFLPTVQLKILGALILCLAAFLVVLQTLTSALTLEAASRNYHSLRTAEWNQRRTVLVHCVDPYDSLPPPLPPWIPSARLKVAFVAGGLVLSVICYGAREIYAFRTVSSIMAAFSTPDASSSHWDGIVGNTEASLDTSSSYAGVLTRQGTPQNLTIQVLEDGTVLMLEVSDPRIRSKSRSNLAAFRGTFSDDRLSFEGVYSDLAGNRGQWRFSKASPAAKAAGK